MIFNGYQRPRQGFGMRHVDLGERQFDMGGGMGRMFNGGINPGGMYTGGNQRPMAQPFGFQMSDGLPQVRQSPWMTGGPGQPFGLASMFRGSAYGR